MSLKTVINEHKKYNKLILTALLLTPVAVLLAATFTFKLGYVPKASKNNGTLLQPPQPMVQLELFNVNGERYDYQKDNKDYGRWHLLIIGDANCATQLCENNLWLTRQLHTALAHRAQYVQRYYVSIGGRISDALAKKISAEHPQLNWLYTSADSYVRFRVLVADKKFDPRDKHQVVLVDPNGWMMMYYEPKNVGQAIIADIKLLLKIHGK